MSPSYGRERLRSHHSKSRNGCASCKKRRIKCDERHPTCANCAIRQLHCSFIDDKASASAKSKTLKPAARVTSAVAVCPVSTEPSALLLRGVTDVSIVHLDLHSHFLFHICPTFTGRPQNDDLYRKLINDASFKHHFLLYQILGLAALSKHLASPNQDYKTIATAFQDQALANLNDILSKVDSNNCIAVLLFAHLVGVHSFCDTFCSSSIAYFNDFLKALTSSAQLLRGMQAILRPFWRDLESSPLGAFMLEAKERRHQYDNRRGTETAVLRTLIQGADISHSSRETYEDAILWLQYEFDELRSLDTTQRATYHTALTWLTVSTPAYVQLMGEARPEALLILAHFAVVLHHRRECWAIKTAGYTLLKSITSRLGSQWKQWLLWPHSEIGQDFPDVAIEDSSV